MLILLFGRLTGEKKLSWNFLDDKNADLETLSLEKDDLASLEKTLGAKSGLILLTEMRLANKNRLLYALLNKFDKELLDIFTLEDFISIPCSVSISNSLINLPMNKSVIL